MHRDRGKYADAMVQSSREELLLNIVRLRYLESPVFLSIGSVVNQYSVESQISAGASWQWGGINDGTGNSLGAAGRFSDKPTITYAPLTGRRFTETMITPIRPESLMAMIEGGWKVDNLFPLMVHSINGIRNRFYAGATSQSLDLRFKQIVDLMSRMQRDGVMSIRVQSTPDEKKPSFAFIISGAKNDEERGRVAELKALLGLDPDAERYRIIFSSMPKDNTEIAVVTRGVLAILGDMSSYVRVPEEHVAQGRALPGAPDDEAMQHPLKVHWSESSPDDAFVKIYHRDGWFWIDDCDLLSKRTFLMLGLISTLAESSEAAQAPLLTIPAG
jgi:hypothetical protein